MNIQPDLPNEIAALLHKAPVEMNLLNGKEYADTKQLKSVTYSNIFAPNSTQFHPEGLFSEEIFGSITSTDRFVSEAVIPLNTTIIHPVIFNMSIASKSLYTGILSGKMYARFDEELHDFQLAKSDEDDAETGYSFFTKHLQKLGNIDTNSLRAENKFKLISKYGNTLMISHLICLPAGLRDIDLRSSRLSSDDINKLYMSVINLTSSLSSFHISDDPIFDGIRYQIQLKVNDIFEYIMNIISGKGGFIQKHYGARKIAFSTRNVISAAVNDADTIDDPSVIKCDETMVPMLNLIKCFQPFFIHYVKTKLYGELFRQGATEKVVATNPKTFELEYITLKPVDINRYTTSEGINKLINQFKYIGFRESPITVKDVSGKEYYVLIVYKHHDKVFIAKSKNDIKSLVDFHNIQLDEKNIHPLTWAEFLYIAGLDIAKDKHEFITRYPVLESGSIYSSKTHITTTNPSKKVTLFFNPAIQMEVPHYPVLGSPYYESLILHQSRLPGLGADHDGDMVSLSSIWTKEGNDDIRNNSQNISSVISENKLLLSTGTDIVNLTIFNLSRQDIEE